MPDPERERLEAELLYALQQAEREYEEAPPENKEAALERYERALGRFTQVVVYGNPDPAPPPE